ncbi:MAG: type I restriction endonuclease [Brooklawnia sp.]|uniref:type I restriction endonuclease subunit R n=1 Tax=Brooklawnia sp. TaxID=2699740 RepID=UPI003C778C4F
MTEAHKELAMENEAVALLHSNGWLYDEGSNARYDRKRALFPDDVFAWLEATQSEELEKLIKPGMDSTQEAKAREGILDALATALNQPVGNGGGTLNILRKGFRRIGSRFYMAQAKPTETLNPKTVADYQQNRLRVVRQVHYSVTDTSKSIDLVLFLNGLPVATIELKTEFTQSVTRGEVQYKNDRNPGADGKELLLAWGKRTLVHFVVTDNEVSMTTKLAGHQTTFLPFNTGDGTGKGNPLNPTGARTEYFWADILDKDMFLTILTKYLVTRKEERPNPVTGERETSTSLRFPRFHQLSAVEKIVGHVKEHGVGDRYLIEHSAGSGKTDTIVWTSFRLAALHDTDNNKVFDSVIVVTDRNVLDKQMTDAMRQLDPRGAQVVSIDGAGSSKSAELADALAMRTPIIVVTIQTAPFALAYLRQQSETKGGRYAVIADEAHSSQTGMAASKLKAVLSPEEQDSLDDGGEIDTETVLAAELGQRAETPNITYLAFTATPKSKTLELFGTPNPEVLDDDGNPKPEPFHRYTMRQAIEEGFILDVLQNFIEYKVAYELALKTRDSDIKSVDKEAARKAALRWVQLHEYNISQKVALIVEHFREHVSQMLGGAAKAMIVTSSRKAALRYYNAVNRYVARCGYTGVRALVAFSGKVTVSPNDPDLAPDDLLGVGEYTEASVNTGTKGRQLADAFNGSDYQVMIVANKFQVGFDQPLLCAMYVDKRLDGVMAVQTLSRLNRTWPGKDQVYVLDFVNSGQDILEAFLPYYEGAELTQTTDPDLVNRIAAKLDAVGLDRVYTNDEMAQAGDAVTKGLHNLLTAAIDPGVQRFTAALDQAREDGDGEEVQRLEGFRSDLSNYVKAYDFLSQIVPYGVEMEQRAIYYRLLAKRLRDEQSGVKVRVADIALSRYRIDNRGSQKIDLARGEATPLTPLVEMGTAQARERDQARWDEIIDAINSLFADSGLTADDAVQQLELTLRKTRQNTDLVAKARANTDQDFNSDPGVVQAFLSTVIDMAQNNAEFTDALLRNQNHDSLSVLLAMLGFRKYLAADYAFPDESLHVEVDAGAAHAAKKQEEAHA